MKSGVRRALSGALVDYDRPRSECGRCGSLGRPVLDAGHEGECGYVEATLLHLSQMAEAGLSGR